jgi:hypothetical protein
MIILSLPPSAMDYMLVDPLRYWPSSETLVRWRLNGYPVWGETGRHISDY